jgi:hypothetical protein
MSDRSWVKDALIAQGYSQRDLATAWGKNEGSVSRFLAGLENTDPALSKAVILAQMLGMNCEDLAARLGLRGNVVLPPPSLPPSSAPAVGTIAMQPIRSGMRVLLHLDLPAELAAKVTQLLGEAAQ